VGFWQSLADALGKIGRVARRFCSFVDVAVCSKICKRQVCVDLTAFVKELIDVAVGEQPPIQAPAGAGVLRVAPDRSRTVLGQCVVPSRMVGEPINFVQIVNQQSPCL
jgi:hypothetical protein